MYVCVSIYVYVCPSVCVCVCVCDSAEAVLKLLDVVVNSQSVDTLLSNAFGMST